MHNHVDASLLRVFITEKDRHDRIPLYEWIVREAREHGIAGVTVLRGLEGFGAHSRIHSAKVLRLAEDLPLVVEIVDERAKIDAFVEHIEPAMTSGLVTIERVEARFFRKGES